MTDKPLKRPRDPVQLAKLMIDIASGEVSDRPQAPEEQGKNAKAVARGKAGGAKGGNARSAKLTPDQRAEIARVPRKRAGKNHPDQPTSFSCPNSSKSMLKLKSICIGLSGQRRSL
jgi:hypothetical protein